MPFLGRMEGTAERELHFLLQQSSCMIPTSAPPHDVFLFFFSNPQSTTQDAREICPFHESDFLPDSTVRAINTVPHLREVVSHLCMRSQHPVAIISEWCS